MGFFSAIENSASGLMAQRLRLDLISNNIANINTPNYQRQVPVLLARGSDAGFSNLMNQSINANSGTGVQVGAVINDQTAGTLEYAPTSPFASKNAATGVPVGYIRQSNVNIVSEMTDMLAASRAYEANVTMMNATKSMATKALEIGKG